MLEYLRKYKDIFDTRFVTIFAEHFSVVLSKGGVETRIFSSCIW